MMNRSDDRTPDVHARMLSRARRARDATLAEFATLAETQDLDAWRRAHRVFAVETSGGRRYPAFQLDASGQPRAGVATVLAALPSLTGWEVLLWLTAENGRLGGVRPVDALADEDRVRDAAAVLARTIDGTV